MEIPKAPTPADIAARDALSILAGVEPCKYCSGTGKGISYQREIDGLAGKVYHFQVKCHWCKGARYRQKEDDDVPF